VLSSTTCLTVVRCRWSLLLKFPGCAVSTCDRSACCCLASCTRFTGVSCGNVLILILSTSTSSASDGGGRRNLSLAAGLASVQIRFGLVLVLSSSTCYARSCSISGSFSFFAFCARAAILSLPSTTCESGGLRACARGADAIHSVDRVADALSWCCSTLAIFRIFCGAVGG